MEAKKRELAWFTFFFKKKLFSFWVRDFKNRIMVVVVVREKYSMNQHDDELWKIHQPWGLRPSAHPSTLALH